ncbi:DUF2752 domain-containing protein [Enterococcus termitis]|nr:DUF2752 domain-containing protein [Enterococcus termitis]
MATVLAWMNNLELCVFKNIFGIPCPGCGMTRAFIHVFQLDLKGAFYYHPLFWLVPIIFGIFLFRNKVPVFKRICQNNTVIFSLLGLFITVYVVRLITLFPTTAPMDFNTHSLGAAAIRWITTSLN